MFKGLNGKVEDSLLELTLDGSPEVLDKIKDYLTVKNKSVQYRINQLRKLEKSSDWHKANSERLIQELSPQVEKKLYGENEDGTLSTGPGFWYLCEKLRNNNHLNLDITKVSYKSKKPPRFYQEELVDELLKYRRAVGVLATGLGKTIVLAMLSKSFVAKKKRIMIVVPTIELVRQTFKFLSDEGFFVSGLGGNFSYKPGCDVLVTTVHSAKTYSSQFDCIIIDETHRAASNMYTELASIAASCKYMYGLTATPIRADGMIKLVHCFCGPVVYEKDSRWGIENKFLSDAKITMIRITGLGKLSDSLQSQKAYKVLTDHYKTHEKLSKLILKAESEGKNTLILFKTVKAGQKLSQYMKKNFKKDVGVASSAYRKPLEDFKNGTCNILISNVSLLGEGVDIPKIDCLINVVQSSSEGITRQCTGRALRISEGKTGAAIVDVTLTGYQQYENAHNNRKIVYATITDNVKVIQT